MRAGLVVVGVVLLILGAVLLFVPLVPQSSVTVTEATPYIANVTGYSLFGSIPGSLTWTSSSSITFFVGTCSQAVTSGHCSGSNTSTTQTGTGGTVTFNVPNGGALGVFVFGNASASVSIKLAETTVGTILLIVGILLLLLGLVLRRKKPAPPTPAATPPSAPP